MRLKKLHGFEVDGTEIFRRHDLQIKKSFYRHRSRGKIFEKFNSELKEVLQDCVDTEYLWDGEDEVPTTVFDIDSAQRQVFSLLKKHGLIKYIK